MRVLLDTQVFLWANAAPERLGAQRELLADPATQRLFSAVSSWEIAIKSGLGRLRLPDAPSRWVPLRARALEVVPVAIEHEHTLAVSDLPTHHTDPFDRLLIAQARSLDAPIITADPAFDAYDVELIRIR